MHASGNEQDWHLIQQREQSLLSLEEVCVLVQGGQLLARRAGMQHIHLTQLWHSPSFGIYPTGIAPCLPVLGQRCAPYAQLSKHTTHSIIITSRSPYA